MTDTFGDTPEKNQKPVPIAKERQGVHGKSLLQGVHEYLDDFSLSADFALSEQIEEPREKYGWIPSTYKGQVEGYVHRIKEAVTKLGTTGSQQWLIGYSAYSAPARGGDSTERQFVKHRAMLLFLDQVGLLDAYYSGDITPIQALMYKKPENYTSKERDSFGINIGYLPKMTGLPGHVYLRAEYRLLNEDPGYSLILWGYCQRKRTGSPVPPYDFLEK